MLIRKAATIIPSEITDKQVYLARRRFMQAGAGLGVAGALGLAGMPHLAQGERVGQGLRPLDYKPGPFSTDEPRTSYRGVTTYNNFYEFGTDKSSPARLAHTLKTTPWSVAIEGEVNKPGVYHLEDILRPEVLQERIYRHRCVEGWSMVIPWVGFPLAALLTRFEPTGKARFVQFTTLYDPGEMPGQRRDVLDWPYVEGLRLDEAMHPLTLLAVGLYGEVLPNQNGAPLRLVVPWKYGFKSIKSIVKIRLMEHPPVSTWTRAAANEYGFYANVNPQVDHPRWPQRTERRIGEFFKRKTLMFNGYGEQVAGLYAGMDLKKYF